MKHYEAMHNVNKVPQRTAKGIMNRDFVFVFFALFTFVFGIHALYPTLPIYLAKSGSNAREIGVIVGIFGISSLFSRLVAGGALRKYSEKSVMIFGALLFAITFVGLVLFHSFWPLFVVRFFQGVAFACLDTAALAFVVKVTAPAYRGQAIGYFTLAPIFTTAIAPVGGMFIINGYSFAALFFTCVVLSLCSFFFALKLKEHAPLSPEIKTPTHNVLFNFRIIVPSITNLLHSFVYGALIAFLPLYAIECGVTNPGYFFSASAAMLIAARILGGKVVDNYDKEKIILIFLFASMAAMVTLFFSRTLPLFILVGIVWGVATAYYFPTTMAYALEYAGSSDGTAVGTFRAISDLGAASGPMVMGLVVPITGYRTIFLCLAFICLLNFCYFHFYVRKKPN